VAKQVDPRSYAYCVIYFHVTSTLNRASIEEHGLSTARMGAARGIAGSRRPEADGIFLCERSMVDFILRLNNTGGPVDLWRVEGIDADSLRPNGSGFEYYPGMIPVSQLTRVELSPYEVVLAAADVRNGSSSGSSGGSSSGPSAAYQSTLTITFDDGRILRGDEARAYAETQQHES
jgi:hypothetical protein